MSKITRDDNHVPYQNNFFLELANGTFSDKSYIEKFGENGEITTATDPEDIWTQGGTYTFSSAADINTLSSSDNGDTEPITVIGLDSDWNEVEQTITLTGQTPVTLTTSLIRVFRMFNSGTSDLAGTVYCFKSGGTVTGGVPQTTADIRATITNGDNQTLMAIYSVPAGKTAYIFGYHATIARGVASAAFANIKLSIRPFGQVFQVKSTSSLISTGQSVITYDFTVPIIATEKSDIKMTVNEVSATLGISGAFSVILIDN